MAADQLFSLKQFPRWACSYLSTCHWPPL